MTGDAIGKLLGSLPSSELVWGGDWNHSLIGSEQAGSMGGRVHVAGAVKQLNLNVPTASLSHRGNHCKAIDHIAVPLTWPVESAKRNNAEGLSDHDMYVVDTRPSIT